jgi:hypothetical protein
MLQLNYVASVNNNMQHILAIHECNILEKPNNGKTVMREVKTLWEKWG